jgi:hypothetical protein
MRTAIMYQARNTSAATTQNTFWNFTKEKTIDIPMKGQTLHSPRT